MVPLLAAGAFAATLGWFGYQQLARKPDQPIPAAAPAAGTAPMPDISRTNVAGPAREGDTAPQVAALPAAPPAIRTPQPAQEQTAPAFDVVRVEPTGDTVIAGRASPGATVEMVLNGARQARVVADPSGLFALVPEALPPGSHELSLQVANADGTRLRSPQSVTVVVMANRRDAPLVTVTAPGQPAVVLSRPAEPIPAVAGGEREARASLATPEPAGRPRRPVQIVSVEAEGAGRLLVSGSASPSAVVRLYLNETFIAPASAGADGRLSFSIARGMQPGAYKVRLDDVDPVSGQVRSRAEVPFSMPAQVAARETPGLAPSAEPSARSDAPAQRLAAAGALDAAQIPPGPDRARDALSAAVVVPEISTATVTRGDSLWAISKRTYGAGLRYTVIYGANAGQIRDPDLIYPGQLFVLPIKDGAGASR